MASADDVKHLAALARLSVPEETLPKLVEEFDGILAYVGQLEELDLQTGGTPTPPPLRNVFREDGEPTPAGTNTEKIAAAFPERKGNSLSVKQIITHD